MCANGSSPTPAPAVDGGKAASTVQTQFGTTTAAAPAQKPRSLLRISSAMSGQQPGAVNSSSALGA